MGSNDPAEPEREAAGDGVDWRQALHDLRNPLTAILGSTQMLHAKLGGQSERVDRRLASILASAEDMSHLLACLGDLLQLGDGTRRLSPTSCSLSAIARESIDRFADTHGARAEVELTEESAATVYVDRELCVAVTHQLLAVLGQGHDFDLGPLVVTVGERGDRAAYTVTGTFADPLSHQSSRRAFVAAAVDALGGTLEPDGPFTLVTRLPKAPSEAVG